MPRLARIALVHLLFVLALHVAACAATPPPCTPGATQACVCTDGRTGSQGCSPSGMGFGPCMCTSTTPPPGPGPDASTPPPPPPPPPSACVPGVTQTCLCTDGRAGSQACNASGTGFGPCACTGTPPGTMPMGGCVPGQAQACACSGGQAGSQICNTAGNGYGPCMCSATCSRAVGQACVADSECCPQPGGAPAVCVAMPGLGQICAGRCNSNSECGGNCCVPRNDGTQVCALPIYCEARAACTQPPGASCTSDESCCADATTRRPTACAGVAGGAFRCSVTCLNNADCTSGCCRARDDGVLLCRPTSECL